MGSNGLVFASLVVLAVGCQQAADEAEPVSDSDLRSVTLDVTGMT
jgi:hypothetical protein